MRWIGHDEAPPPGPGMGQAGAAVVQWRRPARFAGWDDDGDGVGLGVLQTYCGLAGSKGVARVHVYVVSFEVNVQLVGGWPG